MIVAEGGRKFWLGMAFLFVMLIIALATLYVTKSLDGVSPAAFGISAGVLAIAWGNVETHKARNGGSK